LIVLDFGAVAEVPDGIPPAVGRLLRLARDDDYSALIPLLSNEGFIPPSKDISPEQARRFLAPYVDPLRTESFHFTRKWLLQASGQALDIERFQTGLMLSVPPHYVMLFRVLLGVVGISAQMEAEAPYRTIMERWTTGDNSKQPSIDEGR
jgi:predicted unusual protein kinase regulating ubiquinone biosynthesis (AarF/ABC1/UbiB family)